MNKSSQLVLNIVEFGNTTRIRHFKTLWKLGKELQPLAVFWQLVCNITPLTLKLKSLGKKAKTPLPAKVILLDRSHHWREYKDSKNCCWHCKLGFSRVYCDKCNVCLCLSNARNCFRDFHTLWTKWLAWYYCSMCTTRNCGYVIFNCLPSTIFIKPFLRINRIIPVRICTLLNHFKLFVCTIYNNNNLHLFCS